ncbi:MAG: GNAT family N-acetyltransferase [Cyanobacteria bacterium P01_A01_bin.83]
MNEFRYIIGTNTSVRLGLVFWAEKIREYTDIYYQGDKENARGTDFYRCISKLEQISDNILEKEDFVRSVIDDQNLLASISIIARTEILIEDEFTACIEIENISNSPWNTIEFPLFEKRKGAATSLVEGIIVESRSLGLSDILKLFAVPEAQEFYQDLGFEETNGSGEMILSSDAASRLLLNLEQKRNSAAFD